MAQTNAYKPSSLVPARIGKPSSAAAILVYNSSRSGERYLLSLLIGPHSWVGLGAIPISLSFSFGSRLC